MPEGDTLHRAARRLQVLVGQRLEVEAVHPRARAEQVAERIDGRVLESVAAVGKNLVLRFAGGVTLRSHLRMSGRWVVRRRGEPLRGAPWLVLRGEAAEAVLWNGPVLELHTRALRRLGPDILAPSPDLDAMVGRIRRSDVSRPLGEALLDQTLVAGIGNKWAAETLWQARLSPWRRVRDVDEDELKTALETAAALMRSSVDAVRPVDANVYGRAGRPCPRCRAPIRARGLGDDNRTAYWCPICQPDDRRSMAAAAR